MIGNERLTIGSLAIENFRRSVFFVERFPEVTAVHQVHVQRKNPLAIARMASTAVAAPRIPRTLSWSARYASALI